MKSKLEKWLYAEDKIFGDIDFDFLCKKFFLTPATPIKVNGSEWLITVVKGTKEIFLMNFELRVKLKIYYDEYDKAWKINRAEKADLAMGVMKSIGALNTRRK